MWSHAGIICTGETYKNVVKLTFAKGASLEDPSGLFNSSLEGNTRRAIDIREGEDRRGGVEGARSRRRGAERLGPQEAEERLTLQARARFSIARRTKSRSTRAAPGSGRR